MIGHGEHVSPLHMLRHIGEVAECVNEVLHVSLGMGEEFARVKRLDLANDLFVLLNGVGKSLEVHAPLIGRHGGPAAGAKRLGGRLHGPVDIVG